MVCLNIAMEYLKFGSQLPRTIHEKFSSLDYGEKRVASAAAFVWYFNADPEVRRLYREWARAIAEDCATIEKPPDTVAAILGKKTDKPGQNRKKK